MLFTEEDLEKPGHLPKCLSYWDAQSGIQTQVICLQGPHVNSFCSISAYDADALPLDCEFFEGQGHVFFNFASSS